MCVCLHTARGNVHTRTLMRTRHNNFMRHTTVFMRYLSRNEVPTRGIKNNWFLKTEKPMERERDRERKKERERERARARGRGSERV